MFHNAYDLASLIGDCRAITEALPAVIPTNLNDFDLDALTRISSLASAVGRLIHNAEDLAYQLGSDLHDLHIQLTKGK